MKRYSFIFTGIVALALFLNCNPTSSNNNANTNDSIVTDADGNVYHTVKIGTQLWTVENLKTTKFNDGSSIPLVTDGTLWMNLTTPGYCWYDNDAATNKATYGALYNWYAIHTGKLAPVGWHVPTTEEWATLAAYLGGDTVAGGKLKETDTAHWSSPNTGATNESGFSALPGGYRDGSGNFNLIGYTGSWWSMGTYYRSIYSGSSNLDAVSGATSYGISVRVVRNN